MTEPGQEVEEVDDAARETLGLLARGARLQPMLRLLLLDALVDEDRSDRPANPDALVSSNARAATEWIGVDSMQRANALRELLELADALPPAAERPAPSASLPQKIVAVHKALETAELPHTLGGAFAVAYYGVPRMTIEIEVDVFVPARDGEVTIEWGVNPVRLFFSSDDFHRVMKSRIRAVPFAGATVPIPAPEHLIVRKAVLDRPKDWLDIEQILVDTSPLDLAEIEGWLERMVGRQDPRMKRLGEIRDRLGLESGG